MDGDTSVKAVNGVDISALSPIPHSEAHEQIPPSNPEEESKLHQSISKQSKMEQNLSNTSFKRLKLAQL